MRQAAIALFSLPLLAGSKESGAVRSDTPTEVCRMAKRDGKIGKQPSTSIDN